MYKVPKKAMLNAFVPVRVPKVRDVFKRRGFLRGSDTSKSLDISSRNPLEIHDHVGRLFDQHMYEEYAKTAQSPTDASELSPSVSPEPPTA